MSTNMHAAVVVAWPNTKPRIATMTAKNVDVDADREGRSGGRATKKVYDPRERLIRPGESMYSGR